MTGPYAGRLGELRMGRNNLSFERFDDLDLSATAALFTEAAQVFDADPDNVSATLRGVKLEPPR